MPIIAMYLQYYVFVKFPLYEVIRNAMDAILLLKQTFRPTWDLHSCYFFFNTKVMLLLHSVQRILSLNNLFISHHGKWSFFNNIIFISFYRLLMRYSTHIETDELSVGSLINFPNWRHSYEHHVEQGTQHSQQQRRPLIVPSILYLNKRNHIPTFW